MTLLKLTQVNRFLIWAYQFTEWLHENDPEHYKDSEFSKFRQMWLQKCSKILKKHNHFLQIAAPTPKPPLPHTASVLRAGGEPSTKFPPEWLVEQAPSKINVQNSKSRTRKKWLLRQHEKCATTFKKTSNYHTSWDFVRTILIYKTNFRLYQNY